ncbi:MAG: ECF transporter S component [Bacillota bacterium]|nr:ECF transporter S component [Bacillota bacterium]
MSHPRTMPTRTLTLGALLLALGLALPALVHMVGMGRVLLPMHLPILLAGFVVGPGMAALLGVVTPLLSAVLTGMPALIPPVAQAMAVELAVYGFVTGVLYRHTRWHVIPCLVAAMVTGRLGYGVIGFLVLPLLGLPQVALFYPLTYALVTGLPGIASQLVLVPGLVYLVERYSGTSLRANRHRQAAAK